MRLSENAHLPFDRLTALSKVDPSAKLRVDAEQSRSIEGLRYPHPSSLRAGGTAAYFSVRLIPQDFGSLASGHFPPASQNPVFFSLES
jgi:hypothetical protein